jgi:arylsulfatase A-like enzyme
MLSCMSIVPPHADDVRPNIIWFMVDQMRGQALSIAGDPNVRTPNLDRMVIDGTWFRNACMGFPLCCPARGSMLTGVYPHQCVPGHEYPMPTGMPTVADAFNTAGYDTAWFGKWHLDGHREGSGRGAWHIVPKERRGGFGTWLGYENNNSQFDCWVHGHDDRGEQPLRRLPGHETGAQTDMLLAHIDSRREKPFFACVSVQPPHNPYSAPADMAGRHNPADVILRPNVPPNADVVERARRDLSGYYALIEDIDRHVGRLLGHLAALGIADRTYIIFTSDHGDQHGSHGHFAKMTPYEEAIRVPFLVHGGQRWHYHRGWGEVPCIPNHVDLAPTSLGLAGIPVPAGMQGHDFSWAVLRKPAPAGRPTEAYLQSVVPTNHGGSNCQPWRGIVTEDGWKYVAVEGQPLYLFDLNRDPYELVNLAYEAGAAARRGELNRRLAAWIERTGDRFPLPVFDERGVPEALHAARRSFPQPPGA